MRVKTERIDWPKRLPLALLPTPFQRLERLSAELKGPNIWIKRDDLSGSLLSGNKVRKLEFTVAHAKAQNCDVLITCGGLQSNHCRATAFIGAQLGIPVHLVLRGRPPEASGTNNVHANLDGNLLLDHLAGAKITYYETHDYQQNLNVILRSTKEEYRSKGYNPYVIPTGASDGVGLWGYIAACEELVNDFKKQAITPDLIVTATGSGGTQAGLTVGAQLYGLGCDVLGFAVCDDSAYFKRKVTADIIDFTDHYRGRFSNALPQLPRGQLHEGKITGDVFTEAISRIQTNDDYIGEGYGIASDEVLKTILKLASLEGIVLDPVYTGKAFHGLISEIKKGHYNHLKDIVFIHTGGGFGLFPYRDRLQFLMS